MTPFPVTWAKSRTRFNSRFAMRGVPREREASSRAPSGSVSIPKIEALLDTMLASSRGVYSSRRRWIPNRSRKGAASCPERVVAPTKVNFARSMRMERAEGPLPMIMSNEKSSIAG